MLPLNPSQLRAVTTAAATVAVLASPGSGKSSTLVARIAHRVAAGSDPKRIWCLSFTNAAAKVMTDKLAALGITVGSVSTRHGLMYRLINQHGTRLGFRAGGVNIATEEELKAFVPQVAAELGYRGTIKTLNHRADNAAQQVWLEVEHRLKRNNTLSHDTTLAYGLKLLALEDVRAQLQVEELLCDEAQDNSALDWQIDALIPAKVRFVVGDLDQSVYGFRGAWPAGFLQYATDAEERVTMELNYRSGPRICGAASRLIAHNRQRLEKAVVSADRHEDRITVAAYESDRHERQAIASQIANLLNTVDAAEIAVLCRRNDLCELFRQQLEASGIPVAGSEKPSLPPDWSYGLDVLRLLHDPRNDLLAERVIGRAWPENLLPWKSAALKTGSWLSAFIPYLTTPHPREWEMDTTTAAMMECRVSRETRLLVKERLALLPQPSPTLADLLHDLFNHQDWQPREEGTSGVTVSTLHAFKGKEADVVFLPAFEEGTLPTLRKDSTEETIAEERRLAFIGITRARTQCCISWARKRWAWGRTVEQQPSRFIAEANL